MDHKNFLEAIVGIFRDKPTILIDPRPCRVQEQKQEQEEKKEEKEGKNST